MAGARVVLPHFEVSVDCPIKVDLELMFMPISFELPRFEFMLI
jgi:hypothetical protein